MSSLKAERPSGPVFEAFGSADDLHAALADAIAERLAATVARKGSASFVVPGGTTPGLLYDVLSTRALPWENVTIALSDERWTDPTSPRSNEHLTRTRLMTKKAAGARLVPLKSGHSHARDGEAEANAAVAAIARPFDVVLLGMGTDGHTASLIPGAEGLTRALDAGDPALVRAIDPPDLSQMGERITLTLRCLLDTRWIAILIRGEDKRAAWRAAMDGTDVLAGPVRAILHQSTTPVSVYWSP